MQVVVCWYRRDNGMATINLMKTWKGPQRNWSLCKHNNIPWDLQQGVRKAMKGTSGYCVLVEVCTKHLSCTSLEHYHCTTVLGNSCLLCVNTVWHTVLVEQCPVFDSGLFSSCWVLVTGWERNSYHEADWPPACSGPVRCVREQEVPVSSWVSMHTQFGSFGHCL